MNSIVASSLTAAVMLLATGPGEDINIFLNPKGTGVVSVGSALEVSGALYAHGAGNFAQGLDVAGGNLTFTMVGPYGDTPVEDNDYLIVPGTVITTRNGVITAITPP